MNGVQMSRFGRVDALMFRQDLPKPEPASGQVRVRVMASSLNPLDQATWEGRLKALRVRRPPLIPGSDVSGVIDQTGPGVLDWQVGDDVYGFLDAAPKRQWHGFTQSGAWAEYAVTRAETLTRKPDTLSFEEAAAVPVAGLTALQGLNRAALSAGHTILINGASGGVGSLAVQLAVSRGLIVYATSSPQHHATLKRLGVHRVIDYHQLPVSQSPTGLDAVYDVANRLSWAQKCARIHQRGSVIDNLVSLRGGWHRLMGGRSPSGVRHRYTFVTPDAAALYQLSELVTAGKLRPQVARSFQLQTFQEAYRWLATEKPFGKVILTL
ncbi:probable oxidoreductase [Reinekea sp. MED297]|uniref:Probable oxidoreductase n=2 Tax=Reinekea TaxID=230494 RepID=A4BI02_9GAMM|nr:probable oxidoreductase [Reinekea sp. MED297] [Reinekea blandensis MED297]